MWLRKPLQAREQRLQYTPGSFDANLTKMGTRETRLGPSPIKQLAE